MPPAFSHPRKAPDRRTRHGQVWRMPSWLAATLLLPLPVLATEPVLDSFHQDIQPVLDKYCYDCHGYGHKKGGVSLDDFASDAAVQDHALWLRVLKNTRSGIMPPADETPLPPELQTKLARWIKQRAFGLDAQQPDPGRVTVRRLNRVEYRNTIRELTGVDFDTQKEFPADDTGHGFDNIGDVLTISPMLLEKYLDAAQAIIATAVPTQPRIVAETRVKGSAFATVKVASQVMQEPAAPGAPAVPSAASTPEYKRPVPVADGNALIISYYTPATVTAVHQAAFPGKYQLMLALQAQESYVDDQFDLNRCRLLFKADGETLLDREFVREGEHPYEFTFDREWSAGAHELSLEVQPLAPDREQKRQLRLSVKAVTVRGPLAEQQWVQPPNYARFFPGKVPATKTDRLRYARDLLEKFASRAFRRPVEQPTVDRLVRLVEDVMAQPDRTFEAGVAQAMTAILASPRFIFREEEVETPGPGQIYPQVDEFSLASRLSYFLWSSMPDAELFRLAGEGRLRANLSAQVDRMLRDPRSDELVRNFTGQWLQARDIGTVAINTLEVFVREHPSPETEKAREVFRRVARIPDEKRTPEDVAALAEARKTFQTFSRLPKPALTDELREAMKRETEMYFAHVIRENRNLTELIQSDYTFLNEPLARHYGIAGVTGPAMRQVMLPADSPRGGVLTQGTVLAVTSNPTRTSPVKRGVFILDAILGTPPAPPPPNIPPLENVASKEELGKMSLRDTLALHAKNAQCRSCHNRMDPLGLALENFNAMGQWREAELNQPIAPAGQLITGETFANIRELKHILATQHRRDFFYCFSEKLLTYALGRGLDYYDVETLDRLVARLEADGGRPQDLITGIINSAAFQQRRPLTPAPGLTAAVTSAPSPSVSLSQPAP